MERLEVNIQFLLTLVSLPASLTSSCDILLHAAVLN